VILKLVNVQAVTQPVRIDLQGSDDQSDATGGVLTGARPTSTPSRNRER
jgi:hypothetical protein